MEKDRKSDFRRWQCWGQEFESPMLHGSPEAKEIKASGLFRVRLFLASVAVPIFEKSDKSRTK